jgi:endoribonuclease Dicer
MADYSFYTNLPMFVSINRNLEKNLDCLAYTATNTKEIDIAVPKPYESVLSYESPPYYPNYNLELEILKIFSGGECFKIFKQKMNHVLTHLGPWCCDKRWSSVLSDLSQNISIKDLEDSVLFQEEIDIKETFDLCENILTERNPDTSDVTRFSPKVDRLIASLKIESQQSNFCAIIFVERRDTALALHELIECIDDLSHTKPAVLTGHGATEEGDIRMDYRHQNKIIELFRKNKIKLLVATNVAEEGLDIQPCNYVYRLVFFI